MGVWDGFRARANTVKTIGRHGGFGILAGAGFAFMDYKASVEEGQNPIGAGAGAFARNLAPALLFSGPYALAYEALYNVMPAIPSVAAAIGAVSAQRESHIRHSALPFSDNGYVPTVASMQAMASVQRFLGTADGISQAHAMLHSQALRR